MKPWFLERGYSKEMIDFTRGKGEIWAEKKLGT